MKANELIAGAINTDVITTLFVILLIIGVVIFAMVKAVKYAINLLKTKAMETTRSLRESEVARIKAAEWLERQGLIERNQIAGFKRAFENRMKASEEMQKTLESFGSANGWDEKIIKTQETFESLKKTVKRSSGTTEKDQVNKFIVESVIANRGEPITYGVGRKIGKMEPLQEDQFNMIVETILTNEEFITYMERGSIRSKKSIMGHEMFIDVDSTNQTFTVDWNPKVVESIERTPISSVFEIEGVNLDLDSLTKDLEDDPYASIVGNLDDLDSAFAGFVNMDMNSLIDNSISLDGNFTL